MVRHYFKVNDDIVRNSMIVLPELTYSDPKNNPVIVGGMAVQLYCDSDPELLRETTDLDLICRREFIKFPEFEEQVVARVRPPLHKMGYRIQGQKSGKNWAIKVMNGQGNKAKEIFFINFDYPTPQRRGIEKEIVEREIYHAIPFEIDGEQVFVKSLEDLIPRKIKRIEQRLRTLEQDQEGLLRSLYLEAERENWRELAKVPLLEWRTLIQSYQERLKEASLRGEDLRTKPAAYIASKDLYDICLLSRAIESGKHPFNRVYYSQIKQEIERLFNSN